jgi:transcriptional regulator with XRE-family HTH domain
MNFAKTIRHLRDNAKMTQQELANASNFKSSVSISQFEKGNAIPRFDAICRICMALNVSPLEFYLLSVEPEDLYSSNPQRQKYVEGVVKRLGKRIVTESQIKSILDAVE